MMDVISYLGGIINILLGIFIAFGTFVKDETMIEKILRQLYYTPKVHEKEKSGDKEV